MDKTIEVISDLIYGAGLAPELIGGDVGLSVVWIRYGNDIPVYAIYQRRPSRVYGDRPVVVGAASEKKLCKVLRRSVTVPFIHRLDFIRRKINVRRKDA